MSVAKTTQYANRYGLNVQIFAGDADLTSTTTAALMTIDFANVSDIDISSDRTWATGGQAHANKVGFDNPIQGTFTLSTQILTAEVLALMAGSDMGTFSGTEVTFENKPNSMPKYYKIKAETVWQDEGGATYAETMTFHRVSPQKAFNISYSGDGDPLSVDIKFDILEDSATRKVRTINKADSE